MKSVVPTLKEKVTDMLYPKGNFHVLVHNDCWTNNFMFAYDDATGRLKDVKILDLQMMRRTRPTVDLVYFLHMSTDAQFRKENFASLIEFYHAKLTEGLAELGYDEANALYPLETMLADVEDCFLFGHICGCYRIFLVRIVLFEGQNQPN